VLFHCASVDEAGMSYYSVLYWCDVFLTLLLAGFGKLARLVTVAFRKSKLTQQRLKARLGADSIPIGVVLYPLALTKAILDCLIQAIQRLIS
jgi:hypothetical protein